MDGMHPYDVPAFLASCNYTKERHMYNAVKLVLTLSPKPPKP